MSVGFSHIVVNVSNLERSVSFYEMATCLRRESRTQVEDTSLSTLGIARGDFDGWLLRDPASDLNPVVHLVEWHVPKPIGTPYESFWHVGFFRICTRGGDIPALYLDLVAAGADPFTEPLMPEGQNVTGRPAFSVPDPDGIVLQNITLPGTRRISHVAINCTDIEASRSFYEAFGLRTYLQLQTDVPVTNHFGRGAELSTCKGAMLDVPGVAPCSDGDPVFSLDLCRWTLPEPAGSPYDVQNHLGIVRVGLAVDDIEAMRRDLVARGVPVSGPETRDFGSEAGTRTALIVHDPDGAVIEILDHRL
jgi:catechol 2,3-dioxygenase-like lactoylglutathione lyase family enzyme